MKSSDYEYLPINEEEAIEYIARGGFLRDIEDELKTLKVCNYAVSDNSNNLKDVPEHIKTIEICRLALKEDSCSLQYVPSHLIDEAMCLDAIKNSATALEFVPESYKTPDMCLDATNEFFAALEFVPEHYKSLDMCLDAVKSWGDVSERVPDFYKEHQLPLQYVPVNFFKEHPLFYAFIDNKEYCNANQLDELISVWLDDDTIDESDIRSCLNNAPNTVRKTKIWKKWAIMFDLQI